MHVQPADRSTGRAMTSSSWGPFGQAYALSFNGSNVLLQSGEDYDSLAFQDGDNSGSCLSRTEFNESVHRYDLYTPCRTNLCATYLQLINPW